MTDRKFLLWVPPLLTQLPADLPVELPNFCENTVPHRRSRMLGQRLMMDKRSPNPGEPRKKTRSLPHCTIGGSLNVQFTMKHNDLSNHNEYGCSNKQFDTFFFWYRIWKFMEYNLLCRTRETWGYAWDCHLNKKKMISRWELTISRLGNLKMLSVFFCSGAPLGNMAA